MKISTLVFTIFWSLTTYAQEVAISQIEDLMAAEAYDAAIALCDKLIEKGDEAYDYQRIYQLKADALYFINDIPQSLDNYLLSVSSAEKTDTPDLLRLTECYSHVGFCYNKLGAFDKALIYYHQALDLALQIKDSTQIADGYANLGNSYSRIGDYQKGIGYLEKAYQIDLLRKDTAALGFDLKEMARLEGKMGDHQAAADHLKESISLLKKSGGNFNSMAIRLQQLGTAYVNLSQFDSAEYYLKAALNELEHLGDSINVALCWIDLAQLNNRLNNFKKAIEWAGLAKNYYRDSNQTAYKIGVNLSLIESYLGINRPDLATNLINENLKDPLIKSLIDEHMRTYRFQYEVAKSQGFTEMAAESLVGFYQLKDCTSNLNNQRALMEVEMKYAMDKAEQEKRILLLENEVAKTELARKQVLQVSLIVAIIVIVSVAVYIVITQRQKNRLKEQALMGELTELRNQIKLIHSKYGDALDADIESLNEKLVDPLSTREFEALRLTVEGKQNREIAEALFISTHTVKYHLSNVYSKLGVNNRKEALEFVVKSS